jgi:HSP20 family protein
MSAFQEFNKAIQSLLSTAARQALLARWRPAADIYRTREGWLVKLELAGVKEDDIQVSVRGRMLTVCGRRRDSLISEGGEHLLLEISYSEFERQIELPCDLEQCVVTTESRDGMLLLRIRPKNE